MEHDFRKIDGMLDELFINYKELGGTTYTGMLTRGLPGPANCHKDRVARLSQEVRGDYG